MHNLVNFFHPKLLSFCTPNDVGSESSRANPITSTKALYQDWGCSWRSNVDKLAVIVKPKAMLRKTQPMPFAALLFKPMFEHQKHRPPWSLLQKGSDPTMYYTRSCRRWGGTAMSAQTNQLHLFSNKHLARHAWRSARLHRETQKNHGQKKIDIAPFVRACSEILVCLSNFCVWPPLQTSPG